jgi:FtsH-binding integral membrane protein
VAVAYFTLQGKEPSGAFDLPVAAYAVLGIVLVGAAAALARVSAVPSNPAARFRALSLLALVILETGVVLGLVASFLSRRMEPVLVLAATGVVGVLAFVVPAGTAYFRERENRPSGAPPLGPS